MENQNEERHEAIEMKEESKKKYKIVYMYHDILVLKKSNKRRQSRSKAE